MEHILEQLSGRRIRIFVVWEPVLTTDWGRPTASTLKRISDVRASQFWDQGLLISHSIGAHNRRNVVWDYIAVYAPEEIWDERPPKPLYEGGPVVRALEPARVALVQALQDVEHLRPRGRP